MGKRIIQCRFCGMNIIACETVYEYNSTVFTTCRKCGKAKTAGIVRIILNMVLKLIDTTEAT